MKTTFTTRTTSGVIWLCLMLRLICNAAAQNLSCGDVTNGIIGSLGQTNTHIFAGTAGEVIRLTSLGNSGGVGPDIDVLFGTNRVGGFGYNDGISTLLLTNSGTFTVRVHDRGNGHTGSYSLSLVWATPKCGTPIGCGMVITNVLTNSVQQHTYSISGVAGDVIRLTSYPLNGTGVAADMDLFNEAGVLLTRINYNDGFSTFKLTNTATNTLLVRDRGNDNTGTYFLSLVYATPKCAAVPLSCGQVVTNTLTSSVQQHTYSISGVAGEVIRLTSYPLNGTGVAADMDLFNEAGVRVTSFNYNDGFSTFKLTNTATYTLLVRDRDNNNTGTYFLSLVYATPKCMAIPLSCGQVVTNTLTSSVQQDTYSIRGVAGDVIRLTSYPLNGTGVAADMDLFNEAGVRVTSFNYNDGFSTFKLTNTATYTLLVRDRDNNNTGTYFLSLVYATPKCAGAFLRCDIATTNIITTPAQQDMYTLYGYAGERIRLTSVGTSGGVCPDIDVFNESGTRVGGFGCNDFTSRLTLPDSAAYTVVVRDRGNDNAGGYTLSLDAVGGCFRLLVGSVIARTQEVVCLPLRTFVAAPAVALNFTMRAPLGHLSNAVMNTGGRFTSAAITGGVDSQWFISLQASPANPLLGEEDIGSVCFKAVSVHSAFVPLSVSNLVVTNLDGTLPATVGVGGRAVVIASEPLLEATLATNRQRRLTTYGKANTTYQIQSTSDVGMPSPWTPTLTNLVPVSLFFVQTLTGVFSNTPIALLRAKEQ